MQTYNFTTMYSRIGITKIILILIILLNIPACFKVYVNNTIYRKTGVLHEMLVVGYLTEYRVGGERRGERGEESSRDWR